MLRISYRESDRSAVLAWEPTDEAQPWLAMVRRLVFDEGEDSHQEAGYRIALQWWSFIALRLKLLEIFKSFGLSPGTSVDIDAKAREFLKRSYENANRYLSASETAGISEDDLLRRLQASGFERDLKPYQTRNVSRIATLPAAATFSVPGAGKTTEALAVFTLRAASSDRLLVVAPKNAFAAWDEQLSECIPRSGQGFVRLRGGHDKIAKLLDSNPRFMIVTYQQLTRVRDLIARHLVEHRVHVYLDESHRIKSGLDRQTPQAVLSISHLPVGKLIMSGTPMPQAIDDLVPQFSFLYPEVVADPDSVIELIRPVYVRTCKSELGLGPVDRVLRQLPMAPAQGELYKLMKSEVAREAATALSIRSKQAFRRLGRSVARLLQFVSNPSLLATEIEFAHPDLLRAVLAEGEGPKLHYVMGRTRELADAGKKVLIWTSFVRNVEYIAERLSDLGAVFIHGGVDTGEEDDDETREGKIKLFHDDPTVKVLVANPAAASEGVSLHRVCHHAIYLDRTFNAAHYLQSEDRIHRVGLDKDQRTTIEIVECANTVDETVRERLVQKVGAMAEALDDRSLHIDPIPLDPITIDDPDDYVTGLGEADVMALLRDLTGKSGE